MSKHRHRDQPVTRREVLRIVQRARDDIISAVVHSTDGLPTIEWNGPGVHGTGKLIHAMDQAFYERATVNGGSAVNE